jgi:microcystin-dependent protein
VPVTTTNLGLTEPDIGGSNNVWGNLLNTDLGLIDQRFAGVVPFNPTTGAGAVISRDVSGNAATSGVTVSAAAGVGRLIQFLTGTVERWWLGTDGSAESSGNLGSNFLIARFADDGSFIDNPFTIVRQTGLAAFTQIPTAAGSPVLTQATSGALGALVGSIQMWAGNFDPPTVGGVQYWMVCNGRSLLVSSFPALNAAIGTLYGGSGGNFNIPNLQGRTVVGIDGSSLFGSPGAISGELTHTLSVTEMPNHNHTLTDPGHKHQITSMRSANAGNPSGATTAVWSPSAPSTSQPTDVGAGTFGGAPGGPPNGTGITIAAAGGGSGMNIVQPSMAMNFIIRVQ